ncbi:MAG: hypothetical protein U5L04_03985 [Trueperaceae bacterium]|nr:hypothetical protein [Trueperaceae bacterium]
MDEVEKLHQGGSRAIDIFLLPEIRNLKKEYGLSGNPYIIYLAASSLSNFIDQYLPKSNESFQFSRLQALQGEMLLAQGKDRVHLERAINHFQKAQEIAFNITTVSEDVVKAHIAYALLLGVGYKTVGLFDESIESMRDTATFFLKKDLATEVDLVPLTRQEIIMFQTVDGHRSLAERAKTYALLKPVEYYRSLKRVFEFLLNRGGGEEAHRIYSEYQRAFREVDAELTAIARISFAKNIGQYHLVRGNVASAQSHLSKTLVEARNRGLYGQVRQLQRLLEDANFENREAELITNSVVSD